MSIWHSSGSLRQPSQTEELHEPHDEDNPPVETWNPPQDDSHLYAAVQDYSWQAMPPNTRLAYASKEKQYHAYCDACYPHDSFRYILNESYVFKFLFYQAMRSRKKRGGRKSRSGVVFDHDDYKAVMAKHEPHLRRNSLLPPLPENGISYKTFALYKTVLKRLWKQQLAERNTGHSWLQIWTVKLEELHRWVKRRQQVADKANYKEKVDMDFAPYQAVEHFHKIEEQMWFRSGDCNFRTGFCLDSPPFLPAVYYKWHT